MPKIIINGYEAYVRYVRKKFSMEEKKSVKNIVDVKIFYVGCEYI